MFSFNMLLSALVLTLLAGSVDSWFWSRSSSSSGDLTDPSNLSGQRLTDLYNSRVTTAEWVARPKGSSLSSSSSSSSSSGSLLSAILPSSSGVHEWDASQHSGVRVTLEDSSQWLVHKGSGYGISSQTVVTDADHMSSAWRPVASRDFEGTKTVSDFVKTGGSQYDPIKKNCHQAARDMMDQ